MSGVSLVLVGPVCLSGRDNNNGKQVEAASSTPAGLELHPVLRCQRRTHPTQRRQAAPPLTRASGRENVPPGGRGGGAAAAAAGGEPVDPLHLSDVTREQSRLNAASATPNC